MRLSDTHGAIEGDRGHEQPDRAVKYALLEEAHDREREDHGDHEGCSQYVERCWCVDVDRETAHEDQPHERNGDHGCVNRAAPLARPVDVVEVNPEGELVNR